MKKRQSFPSCPLQRNRSTELIANGIKFTMLINFFFIRPTLTDKVEYVIIIVNAQNKTFDLFFEFQTVGKIFNLVLVSSAES